MRSNVSLDSSREVTQDCGISFINHFYLILLIINQNFYTTLLFQIKQAEDKLWAVRGGAGDWFDRWATRCGEAVWAPPAAVVAWCGGAGLPAWG